MRRTALHLAAVAAALAALVTLPAGLAAQSFRRAGVEFHAVRKVSLPGDKDKEYSIAVVQFFHHGEISPDGRNVLAATQDKKPVPTRVLQLGPGDYCRLAFQTVPRQKSYEVFYGGDAPKEGAVPPWSSRDGLLLETRHYKDCNLNSLESVREAFNGSKRIGSDYVDSVKHSDNPFSLRYEPFLSRYSGTLQVGSGGTYRFYTSSQDCSFLLIDDKIVVDAPGRHRSQRRAQPGTHKRVRLSAGAHKFEYYHAASGPTATMIAAWEASAGGAKPAPVPIPPEMFRAASVGHVQAGPVSLSDARLVPDFVVNIAGDVPLPDNDLPLIGVKFVNVSPPALTLTAKPRWEFGDGQTGDVANPVHVYLRPGTYSVKMSVRRGRTLEMVNRVYVDRPKITKREQFHKLDEYLPILASYDPKTLDAVALRQLVLAYQFKADTILAPSEPESASNPDEPASREEAVKAAKEKEAKKAEAKKYLTAAVAAAQVAFIGESGAEGDEDLIKLVRLIGPMARDELGDSPLAARIWEGAAGKITNHQLKAECEVEAADVNLNDLLKREAAKPLLDAASSHLPQGATGQVASRLKRVWGDYHAAGGNGEAARKSYNQAEAVLQSTRTHIERAAWQGAHSRSTEQFLRTKELDRAARQLRAWQDEFPSEKADGYLSLMFARYWAAREMHEQAVALAEAQLVVNPDSPYIDQLLLLAAQCEVKRGEVDGAKAILNQLLKDYPGSPLVPVVREYLDKL